MKRAFKRPQTIVYRACRIVAMRLTYTSAQETFQPFRVSRRPLTEFTPLVPHFTRWSWAGGIGGGSSSTGRRRRRLARERSDQGRHRVLARDLRHLGGQFCNSNYLRQVSFVSFILGEINLSFLKRREVFCRWKMKVLHDFIDCFKLIGIVRN